MKHPYKFSFILILVSTCYFIISYIYNIDAFEFLTYNLKRIDQYELDEIIICSFLLGIGILIDSRRKLAQINLKEQKVNLYKETMSAVLHIFFNFLQNAYYFNQYARANDLMEDDELERFEKVIFENKEKITKLHEIEEVSIEKIRETLKHFKEELLKKE